MDADPTGYGSPKQPLSVGCNPYRVGMAKSPVKVRLWENVTTLMQREYGGENLSRLARDTGIGPGSATRIKAQDTSVGFDVLEKISARFGLQPWQLLAPDLGAELLAGGVKLTKDEMSVLRKVLFASTPPPVPPSHAGEILGIVRGGLPGLRAHAIATKALDRSSKSSKSPGSPTPGPKRKA